MQAFTHNLQLLHGAQLPVGTQMFIDMQLLIGKHLLIGKQPPIGMHLLIGKQLGNSKQSSDAADLLTPQGFESWLVQIALSVFYSGIVNALHMDGLHPHWPLQFIAACILATCHHPFTQPYTFPNCNLVS